MMKIGLEDSSGSSFVGFFLFVQRRIEMVKRFLSEGVLLGFSVL